MDNNGYRFYRPVLPCPLSGLKPDADLYEGLMAKLSYVLIAKLNTTKLFLSVAVVSRD